MNIIKNKYKLVQKTPRQGGMSETYFAEDLTNKKKVVVKFFTGISNLERSRFIREIKILKKYKTSEFIIPIIDFDTQYNPPFFVMPKASCDLSNLNKLSIYESKRYFYKMLDCVKFIHDNQAFHRDIKPENFLIYNGTVVSSDFGLFKDIEQPQITESQERWGTRYYMPPEFQVENGFRNPQKSSDLYSLGKTFYFLLTGKNPIYIEQDSMPDNLYKVIKKATDENPQRRYQNCSEFQNALKNVYAEIDQQFNIHILEPIAKTEDLEKSIKNYNNLIDENPNNIAAYYNRGLDKQSLGRYEEALEDYNKVIELNPNYSEAYNNRGGIKVNISKYAEALKDFSKAVKINSDYAEAYNNIGLIQHELEKYTKAIRYFNKAIKLNLSAFSSYYNRGLAKLALVQISQEDNFLNRFKNTVCNPFFNDKFKADMYEEAIKDFNKAIELNPYFFDGYNDRGNVKSDLNKHREAIKDYDKAIELNPIFFGAYNNRGLSKAELGKHKEAIKDFDEALKLDPKYIDAYYNRGLSRMELNEYKEAIKDFDEALSLIHTILKLTIIEGMLNLILINMKKL